MRAALKHSAPVTRAEQGGHDGRYSQMLASPRGRHCCAMRALPAPPSTAAARPRLPWPLPALLSWAAAWAVWWLAAALALPPVAAFCVAAAVGAAPAWRLQGAVRRTLVAAGFPLSAWALGTTATWPVWAWPLLLLPLLLAYPLGAWRDAPFFPTPAAALLGLHGTLGPVHRCLDAGCGLGHGLQALRREWPQAHCEGVEWSLPLALMARLRCPWALIRRGDMWAGAWHAHDLVYVFQRPESMARVWAKAVAEMQPGAWLASLEFAVPGVEPAACWQRPGQRPLWLYRPGSAQPTAGPADNATRPGLQDAAAAQRGPRA